MKRIICLLLVLIMVVSAAVSCGGGNVSEDTSFSPDTTLEDTTEEPETEEETEAPVVLKEFDLSQFKIVYSDDAYASYAEFLRDDIKAKSSCELEVVKEKISVRSEDLKAKQEELANIVEATSKEEEQLRANRDACAEKIDERTMSAYEHIRNSCNNRLAVVSVFNGDSCGGCFNTIAPQRLIDIASNRKMIICEYCGRILVNPDFE